MNDTLTKLYDVILSRKGGRTEGSYTCYLFEQGIDKILKKCGEECAELIIAAKNGEKSEVVLEACDLVYHLLVLLAECGVPLSDMDAELKIRLNKQLNLKPAKSTDRNT